MTLPTRLPFKVLEEGIYFFSKEEAGQLAQKRAKICCSPRGCISTN